MYKNVLIISLKLASYKVRLCVIVLSVTVCTVGYICLLRRDQIFMLLSMGLTVSEPVWLLWPIILKRSTRFLENVAGESLSCVSLTVSSSWLISSRASSMLYVYVSKGYVRKIIIVNDYNNILVVGMFIMY